MFILIASEAVFNVVSHFLYLVLFHCQQHFKIFTKTHEKKITVFFSCGLRPFRNLTATDFRVATYQLGPTANFNHLLW